LLSSGERKTLLKPSRFREELSAKITPAASLSRETESQRAVETQRRIGGGGYHRRALSAFLKFCGFLALVFGSGGMLLQSLGSAENLSPADAPGYVTMAKPLSAPAGASDAMHTIPEPPPIARNSGAAPDSSTGHSGVVLLGANVRTDPSADAPVLRTVGPGVYVRVFARRDGWLQVGHSQPWGWVHVSRIEDLVGTPSFDRQPATSTDNMAEPPRIARNSGAAPDSSTGHSGVVLLGANVRTDPSADAPVLRTVGSGVYARVFARRDGWLQVGRSQPWGWVHVSRTKDLVGAPPSEPPPAAGGTHSEPLLPDTYAAPSEKPPPH
jgi:SH3-like domain-containing protein